MAGEKFLFVDADGFYTEDSAAIQSSSGMSDADKLVKTGSDGKLDPSLLNFQTIKRYFVADMATQTNISLATAPATIDSLTPSNGDRILVKAQTLSEENGIYIYNGAGSAMTRATDYDEAAEIEDGSAVAVGQGTDADKLFLQTEQVTTVGTDAIQFINVGTNAVEAGAGIVKSGNKLSADLLASGGLKFVGVGDDGELSIEPADFSGEGLIDDGADNLAIDWSTAFNDAKAVKAEDLNSTANGEGASIIGIEDSANYFTSTDVEGALAELAAADLGETFTVGTGGVTLGDLLFISANDTVETHDDLSLAEWGIGLARSTEAAAGSVVVVGNDSVLEGALVGATAGTKYYWDGSALTSTLPSTSGSHIYRVGVAKNATDLYVDIEFVKKNK